MTSLSHATTATAAAPRLRIWQWLIATLIGFPVGGEVANVIIGPVNSVGAALAGGFIAGAVIGAAQWLAFGSSFTGVGSRPRVSEWPSVSRSAEHSSTTGRPEVTSSSWAR